MITDIERYEVGQKVQLHGSAGAHGHAGKTGTVVKTYNDRGADINITLYLVKFDGGGDFWTNETEMSLLEA